MTASISSDKLKELMLNHEFYPNNPPYIEFTQTHISMVFLTNTDVFKIKKPVDFGFLDFTTLEKRKYYCYEEVQLNRRFSKGIYKGVVPIYSNLERTQLKIGKTFQNQLSSEWEIIEYAVKMKRIPGNKFLKYYLDNDIEVPKDILKNIGVTLRKYHDQAKTTPDINEFGKIGVIKQNTDENFKQTEKYLGITIDQPTFERIKTWTNNFYIKNQKIFDQRLKEGKIKDCHGDLHTEHILITDPIALIDCIEFNERFRYGDVLSDLGFLLMDLDFLGYPQYGNIIKKNYFQSNFGPTIEMILTFYQVYRSYVRGKVTSFRLDEEELSIDEKQDIAELAKQYFELAMTYIQRSSGD